MHAKVTAAVEVELDAQHARRRVLKQDGGARNVAARAHAELEARSGCDPRRRDLVGRHLGDETCLVIPERPVARLAPDQRPDRLFVRLRQVRDPRWLRVDQHVEDALAARRVI